MALGSKFSGAIISVFLLTSMTFGQSGASAEPAATSRADLWKKAKFQKQQTSTPLKLSWIERLLASGEKGSLSPSPAGIHPTAGTVTSGSGPSFGARFGLHDIGGFPVDLGLKGAASTRKYQDYGLEIGDLGKREGTFTLQPFSRRLTTEFDEGPWKKEPGRAPGLP